MRLTLCLTISAVFIWPIYSQTAARGSEFEVVSIKPVAPMGFFHASDTSTGGPNTPDRARFHCTCTLAALVSKAFDLQKYQFPGESSLPAGTFDVSAKIPEGTTQEQFLLMLQNMLKDRFGLAWHFEEKEMQGYQLVLGKGGPKLKESTDAVSESQHGGGGHEMHGGLINFNGQARYRGDHKTMQDLALLVSNQIMKPVADETGLRGKYDISLSWSGDPVPHNHVEGAGGYGDHGAAQPSTRQDDTAGMTIFEALQSQLGLKLLTTRKSMARIFVVDHVAKAPTEN